MSSKKKINLRKIRNNLDLLMILLLWISTFFGIFYKGSINAGIWGKWQGLEIVFPLIISFFISSVIILPIYLIRIFYKKKK